MCSIVTPHLFLSLYFSTCAHMVVMSICNLLIIQVILLVPKIWDIVYSQIIWVFYLYIIEGFSYLKLMHMVWVFPSQNWKNNNIFLWIKQCFAYTLLKPGMDYLSRRKKHLIMLFSFISNCYAFIICEMLFEGLIIRESSSVSLLIDID